MVVNYNAGSHLLACVQSLRAEGVARVVVVDNASSDGSLAALQGLDADGLQVVDAGSNLGFGTAANRGLAVTTSEYVVVLNPDTVVAPEAVATLAAALDADPKLAVVGPRVDNIDGTRYPSARRFPAMGVAAGHAFLGLFGRENSFTHRYRMLDLDVDRPGEVDWVSGAFFMARRSALVGVGGFDESYFMYVEDVDLCWRLGRAGWRIGYEPSARVVHEMGVSSRQAPYRMIVEHHRSLWRFAGRTTHGARRAALPAVAAGLAMRTALACAAHAAKAYRGHRRTHHSLLG